MGAEFKQEVDKRLTENDKQIDNKDAEALQKVLNKNKTKDIAENVNVSNQILKISNGVKTYIDSIDFDKISIKDLKYQQESFQKLYDGLLSLSPGIGNQLIPFKDALDSIQKNIDSKESNDFNDSVNNCVNSLLKEGKISTGDITYINLGNSIVSIKYKNQELNIKGIKNVSDTIKDFIQNVGYIDNTGIIYDSKSKEFYYQGVYKPRSEINNQDSFNVWKNNIDKSEPKKLIQLLETVNNPDQAAKELFENSRPLWNALFETDFDENNNSSLNNFVSIYIKQKVDDIGKIEAKISNGNDGYLVGEKYLKIIPKDGKTLNGNKFIDIYFGKTSEIIHQARVNAFNEIKDDSDVGSIKKSELFKKPDKENYAKSLEAIKYKGSHLALESLSNNGLDIKTVLNKDFFESIIKGGDNIDGYFGVITDQVVKSKNPDILKQYLDVVNANNMKYLGTNKESQRQNFDKIIKSADKIDWTGKETLKKDLIQTIANMRLQLIDSPKSFKENLEGGVKEFFKAFGPVLVDFLEFFGGKGCVKKFFEGMGAGAAEFYAKNFGAIEEGINEIYKKKYEFSTVQKEHISLISESIGNTDLDTKDPNFGKSDWLQGKFENKKKDFLKEFKKTVNKESMPAETLASFIENYNNSDEVKKSDPSKAITISDYIIKSDKGLIYKNNEINFTGENPLDGVFNFVLGDKTTWDTISESNTRIITEYKTDNKDKALNIPNGQPDLSIKNTQDIARYLAMYMFRGPKNPLVYSITENKMDDVGYSTETKIKLIDYRLVHLNSNKDNLKVNKEGLEKEKILLEKEKDKNKDKITELGNQIAELDKQISELDFKIKNLTTISSKINTEQKVVEVNTEEATKINTEQKVVEVKTVQEATKVNTVQEVQSQK